MAVAGIIGVVVAAAAVVLAVIVVTMVGVQSLGELKE
jgi:hypothetical protein